ncbi:hypothetical protein [Flavobacterium suzhouense]|uniref:DUF8192 domain-containing protein n=1 Tax=Flavobacterium suzhouense TaxID=1529638 RepID=A0ABW5NRN2_9FLAO
MKHFTLLLLLFTSLTFAQKPERCGLDDNPLLNNDEAAFLNNYYKDSRGNFDFTGKKIAIATGSAATTPFSKKQFFGALKTSDKEKPSTKLYLFNKSEKAASDGYDAVISFYTKKEVDKKKIIEIIRKGEWNVPAKK